jgi:hypothetical protein
MPYSTTKILQKPRYVVCPFLLETVMFVAMGMRDASQHVVLFGEVIPIAILLVWRRTVHLLELTVSLHITM